ncbi:unnamed protein product [Arabis nemorensis]|uniref:Uncharacterized protein n=1 Tax=Arabis nemorensis TaxID=586526 RepID=A0A565CAN7_9BRAS|nr:unnamed protein product [Arabis nemorensis]
MVKGGVSTMTFGFVFLKVVSSACIRCNNKSKKTLSLTEREFMNMKQDGEISFRKQVLNFEVFRVIVQIGGKDV